MAAQFLTARKQEETHAQDCVQRGCGGNCLRRPLNVVAQNNVHKLQELAIRYR